MGLENEAGTQKTPKFLQLLTSEYLFSLEILRIWLTSK